MRSDQHDRHTLCGVSGLAFAPPGILYASDTFDNRVVAFDVASDAYSNRLRARNLHSKREPDSNAQRNPDTDTGPAFDQFDSGRDPGGRRLHYRRSRIHPGIPNQLLRCDRFGSDQYRTSHPD